MDDRVDNNGDSGELLEIPSFLRRGERYRIESSAIFSPCRTYRYALWRWWGGGTRHLVVIGLNPSTADEMNDDPTVRRCKRFARDWGYSGLCIVNLFALRATMPKDMMSHPAPVGEDNDFYLRSVSRDAGMVLAAWGNHGAHLARDWDVRRLIEPIQQMRCLGVTNGGQPKHPLYIKADTQPIIF